MLDFAKLDLEMRQRLREEEGALRLWVATARLYGAKKDLTSKEHWRQRDMRPEKVLDFYAEITELLYPPMLSTDEYLSVMLRSIQVLARILASVLSEAYSDFDEIFAYHEFIMECLMAGGFVEESGKGEHRLRLTSVGKLKSAEIDQLIEKKT